MRCFGIQSGAKFGVIATKFAQSVIITPIIQRFSMKHLFSFLAAAMLASAAWAQTTVTLTVDMTNEDVSMDGVHVAGNFQGWDPSATPMTDNGDGTWSHTFTVDSAATYQYKYVNGNAWGTDEGVPGACAFDGNRQISVDLSLIHISEPTRRS